MNGAGSCIGTHRGSKKVGGGVSEVAGAVRQESRIRNNKVYLHISNNRSYSNGSTEKLTVMQYLVRVAVLHRN